MRLCRTIRFAADAEPAPHGRNAFAGSPPMHALGAHYELQACIAGTPDPATGYLMDIKAIDRAVRDTAIPRILAAFVSRSAAPAPLLAACFPQVNAALSGSLVSLRWRLTPTYALTVEAIDMTAALLRQKFDFAASHRLHAPSLTPEENRRCFGKCNNPNGHGHNYQFEICLRIPASGPHAPPLHEIETLCDTLVVERFDHKHLNLDTTDFSDHGGLNPTVENIARVIFGILAPEFARRFSGCELREVTVWETDRTCATFPG